MIPISSVATVLLKESDAFFKGFLADYGAVFGTIAKVCTALIDCNSNEVQ